MNTVYQTTISDKPTNYIIIDILSHLQPLFGVSNHEFYKRNVFKYVICY